MHLLSGEGYDSCCDLLCSEDAGTLTADTLDEESQGCPSNLDFPEDSDESMAEFVEAELAYSRSTDYPARFRSRSLDPLAREEAVTWILKVQDFYRFQPLTAYLCVNYMDRFLSSHSLPQASGWPLQLLAVACLSLASKMEETLVPSLLDFQVEGARYIFEPRTVCRMELLVLTALKWRLRSVTPFTFIDYFACKADPSGTYTRYLVSRAAQVILATTYGIDFLDQCPSSVAAAALICATDETPDLAFIDPESAKAWCVGLSRDGITNCYRLMQEVVVGNTQRPPRILPQLRVTTPVSMCAGASSSSHSNKRRKLSNCRWVDDDNEISGDT